MRTRAIIAASLAIILTIELIGIAGYTYYRLHFLADPSLLADRVEEALRENYPDVRNDIVQAVKEESPAIADQVSQEILKSTPSAREYLVKFTGRQIDAGLDQATELSEETFRGYVDGHRREILDILENVEEVPDETRDYVLGTEADIEQTFGFDIQTQAKNVLTFQRKLNEKLYRLSQPVETLDRQQMLARRIVRILRTIQLEELGQEQTVAQSHPARTADSSLAKLPR